MSYGIFKTDLKKDRDSIIKFWENNFPQWPSGKFDWYYQTNPSGSAECWLIKHEETAEIVGATAVFPRDFQKNNVKVKAAITGDFGVDKKHRILGPALKLQKSTTQENEYQFLYGFPNNNSEPVQKRVGFKKVGDAMRYVKVLKINPYLERKIKSDPLTKLISPMLNAFLKLFFLKGKFNKSNYHYNISDSVDQRFDELWQSSDTGDLIIGERNSKYLDWRLQQCPYYNFKLFTLTNEKKNKLCGYVAYYISENTVFIMDIFASDLNENFKRVLSAFIYAFSKENINSISVSFLGNDRVLDVFNALNFKVREDKRSIVAYLNERDANTIDLFNLHKWYFFEIDND